MFALTDDQAVYVWVAAMFLVLIYAVIEAFSHPGFRK
jgi:hypothetical protein